MGVDVNADSDADVHVDDVAVLVYAYICSLVITEIVQGVLLC